MSRINRIAYALTSGILLSLAWTQWMNGLVLMIAFVPLLAVENYFYRNQTRYRSIQVMFFAMIGFFVWNGISTWWIWNASPLGAVMATLLNTIWMSTVFFLFHYTRRKVGERAGYFALIFFWIAFEYFHLRWELNWSWLNLGNGLAKNNHLIQWYEYTGILGGSLWVLLSNILVMTIIQKHLKFRTFHSYLGELSLLILWIAGPILLSYGIYNHYEEKDDPYTIVATQPNIDPYTEKFNGMNQRKQIEIMLNLADSLGDDDVDFFVGPETSHPRMVWEKSLHKTTGFRMTKEFMQKYPNAYFVTGLSTKKQYGPNEEFSVTARQFSDTAIYYDVYNSAIIMDALGEYDLYYKSKLVIGVETMPFPKTMKFLESLILDLGGTTGSHGMQKERSVFEAFDSKVKIAPIICYESIYGEYVTDYIKKGANIIFVVTNDGWWGDTPGYRQHLTFSQLIAIETRRSIARSANTGTSCFINQRGDLIQATDYWVQDVIKADLNTNDKITWYVRNGDFLGRIFSFFSILILLYAFTGALIARKKTTE